MIREVKCLNCWMITEVNFSPMAHTVCPNCGAPSIKLVKLPPQLGDPGY